MSDDTQTFTKEPNGASKVFGVSVRAWIVLMFDSAVLSVWITNNILACLGYTSVNTVIPEPIYTVFVAVNTYYFSNMLKK